MIVLVGTEEERRGMLQTGQRIRIVVADDHPLMREGLRCIIEQEGNMSVVAEAGDGAEAWSTCRCRTWTD